MAPDLKSQIKRTPTSPSAPTLVHGVGCAYCWRAKRRSFLRACGKPNPILLAA
jgi:sporulation killing factor